MILEWMLYTVAVTLLVAWAAWALEEIAVSRGFPARVIWIAAVVGSLLLPQALHLRPRTGPSVTISIRGVGMPWASGDRGGPTAPDESSPEAVAPRDIERELTVIWGTSSALVLGVFAISAALITRRRRRWKLQVMNRRRIWISADTGPAVVGFFPGEIVLPEWILASPSADRRLAITHEEEHIRARDPLIVFGIAAACAAMPWNLPLWWIASRLRRAIELDCDRRLITFGFSRRSYSRLLIEVTERGLPHYMAVTGMSGSSSFLEKRIRLLLGRRRQSPVRSGALAAAASLVLLVAYSIDPPAGLAEELESAPRIAGLSVESALEIFEVVPSGEGSGGEAGAAGGAVEPLPLAPESSGELGDTLIAPSIGRVEVASLDADSAVRPRSSEASAAISAAAMPADSQVEVCVVQNGALQNTLAIYRPETGDTLLGSTRFSEIPASWPSYAQKTGWLERRERVTFQGRQWVPFGDERTIRPDQLQGVGVLNGVTVYAEAGSRTDRLDALYVPVRPGCYFQAYQVVATRRGY